MFLVIGSHFYAETKDCFQHQVIHCHAKRKKVKKKQHQTTSLVLNILTDPCILRSLCKIIIPRLQFSYRGFQRRHARPARDSQVVSSHAYVVHRRSKWVLTRGRWVQPVARQQWHQSTSSSLFRRQICAWRDRYFLKHTLVITTKKH